MTNLFELVSLGETQHITRRDGTEAVRQTVVLRELGGEHQDSFLATWFGQGPLILDPGMVVAASLRFQVREVLVSGTATASGQAEERQFQDIYIRDLRRVAALKAEASGATAGIVPPQPPQGGPASPLPKPGAPAAPEYKPYSYATLPGIPITEAAPF